MRLRRYRFFSEEIDLRSFFSCFYETNGSNKIAFHTLSVIPKEEPWTEHIVCFDIELEERSFERVKSKANNIIAEFCGYLSVLLESSLDGEKTLQMRTGELSALERIFDSHRLYKIKESIKNSKDYKEERIDKISTKIHFMNEPINIPNVLRRYIRGIEEYKKENFDNYLLFRNVCRLYNKSKVLSVEGASSMQVISHFLNMNMM